MDWAEMGNRRLGLVAAATLVAVVSALVSTVPALAGTNRAAGVPRVHRVLRGGCALHVRAGFSHCNLLMLGSPRGRAFGLDARSGYGPAVLQSAYKVAGLSSGQTVAIVYAYDDNKAETDLATYRSWQTDGRCARRTVADVSAVADPNTGVAVYDSNCSIFNQWLGRCFKGWGIVGDTSASAPIIASVYALAGNAGSVVYGSYPYSHTSGLFDVTAGSNGSCSGSYLCTAGAGYDGPTGLGTPNGTSGF
jgi:hypothetical protein